MGGHFVKHPKGTPEGEVSVVNADHPSTKGLPASIKRVDEWYYFDDYDPTSRLLITLDPASIGEKDVNPNPVSWAREFDGGRIFYTAMGHTAETFAEPYFLDHLKGGLHWAMKK
jgi:type 1 glutamine amidotransferase